MNSTVRASSNPVTRIHPPTLALLPRAEGESFGQALNRILEITDETVRQSLISDVFEELIRCPVAERRQWWETMQALIEGRPQEDQERLDAERMSRARR